MIFQIAFIVPDNLLLSINGDSIIFAGKEWSIDRIKDSKGFTRSFIAYINSDKMALICKMEIQLKKHTIGYNLRFIKDQK